MDKKEIIKDQYILDGFTRDKDKVSQIKRIFKGYDKETRYDVLSIETGMINDASELSEVTTDAKAITNEVAEKMLEKQLGKLFSDIRKIEIEKAELKNKAQRLHYFLLKNFK